MYKIETLIDSKNKCFTKEEPDIKRARRICKKYQRMGYNVNLYYKCPDGKLVKRY